MNRGVEMTVIQVCTDVQKCDLGGGGVQNELGRVISFEAFKELGEEAEAMGPEEEDVINKLPPKAGHLVCGKKEALNRVA